MAELKFGYVKPVCYSKLKTELPCLISSQFRPLFACKNALSRASALLHARAKHRRQAETHQLNLMLSILLCVGLSTILRSNIAK